jgi:hypothetical protein
LISVCIPAQVGQIPDLCFCECDSLPEVTFEPGSKLIEICDGAFSFCSSLHSIVFPARVEIVMFGAMESCNSLTQLTFEMTSQMIELDLPPVDFCSLTIPDSVEIVHGMVEGLAGQRRLLEFGRESQLSEIDLITVKFPFDQRPINQRGNQVFICLSDEVLRRFRFRFEAL